MAKTITGGLFGNPVRFYVEAAELPWVALTGGIALVYILSYWLAGLDIMVMPPLVLILQVLGASLTAYLTGVREEATWAQTLIVCLLVGIATGAVSALLALFRFWYPWLIFNLVVEPVWSGLLAVAVGSVTISFFHLPALLKRYKTFTS